MKLKLIAGFLCAAMLLSLIPGAASAEVPLPYSAAVFSEKDLDQTEDLRNAVTITLDGTSALADGKEAAENGVLTIPDEGVYVLTGSFQGTVVVDCGKKDKVMLILSGADITSEDSAAIYVKKAKKAVILLAEGTVNTLKNGGSYVQTDKNNVDAVIFSKTDLVLKGSGALSIDAKAGHGIVSKDDLIITGGSYTIDAAQHGITAKDNLRIAGGSFSIASGSDGLRAKNADDTALGTIYIQNGSFTITSAGKGICASGDLQIDDGSFDIISGGGSENGQMKLSDAVTMQWGFRGTKTNSENKSTAKGIQSGSRIFILSGSFHLDCADDAIHSTGDLYLGGGDWEIRTADDAIHSEENTVIEGGRFQIPYCYEGIEGHTVTIDGGSLDILSTDDGINAAGEAEPSAISYGPFGIKDSGAFINVNGGSITIVSDGDCLDSNGSITLTGGTLNLTCNGYGNTAIDYELTFTNDGADLTTNDGSENGDGSPFGMFGFGNSPGGKRQEGTKRGGSPKNA